MVESLAVKYGYFVEKSSCPNNGWPVLKVTFTNEIIGSSSAHYFTARATAICDELVSNRKTFWQELSNFDESHHFE